MAGPSAARWLQGNQMAFNNSLMPEMRGRKCGVDTSFLAGRVPLPGEGMRGESTD